uniref:(northern house mosquito) hypothetical protein n=1 Tax=Culex pipiens TaxID=7175 RepID=A0A8D8HK32_CULPI
MADLMISRDSDVFGILIRSPCMPASDDSGSALMACRFMRGSALTGGSTRVFSTPGDHASNVSSEQRFSMRAFVMGRTTCLNLSISFCSSSIRSSLLSDSFCT